MAHRLTIMFFDGVGWKYLCLQSRLPDRDGEFDDVDSMAVVTITLDEP